MSIRDLLDDVPVFDRPLPAFTPGDTPVHPNDLFASWLAEAVRVGVIEPHAMSLSTLADDGLPDTRVVLLRDVDERGWQFAADSRSAKGRQITCHPVAALGFYWREQCRQVRVRGTIDALDCGTSRTDFLSRSLGSRVASLSSRQSSVLADPADLVHAIAAAEDVIRRDPEMVHQSHNVYAVTPVSVEFWQGDRQRRHLRLLYRKAENEWIKQLLWP